MNYRFRVSERTQSTSLPRPLTRRFRLKGADTLRKAREEAERIRLSSLFGIGELPVGTTKKRRLKKPRPKRTHRQKSHRLRRAMAAIERGAEALLALVRARINRPRINTLPIFAGALCAALLIGALSSGSVLISLFGGYRAPYQAFTVPKFVGEDPAKVLSREAEQYGDALPWNLIVQYAEHEEIEDGRVISQSPAAGVTRRIYRRSGACNITLTVSRGRPSYELPHLVGKSERDALLALQNMGLLCTVHEVTSETVPNGTVIGTIPSEGATLREGERVVLQISRGASITLSSVPNLLGLTEAQASALLRAKGFTTGSVSYQSSSRPAGTVIAQTPNASLEAQEGSAISYTVSLGQIASLRTVPNLCGLSYADAVARLREYGLVVGSITSVAHAAPRGTVIEQTPPAGTPITSSTVSVDLYLSN